jgi:hypothetical protein
LEFIIRSRNPKTARGSCNQSSIQQITYNSSNAKSDPPDSVAGASVRGENHQYRQGTGNEPTDDGHVGGPRNQHTTLLL